MNAIEFLKTPFYISNMNTIMPLTTINLYILNVSKYVGLLINFAIIIIQTAIFISFEVVNMLTSVLEIELIVYIIGAYSVFMFLLLEDHKNNLEEQTNKMKMLENEINHLKKIERMCENDEQILIKEIRQCNEETNKKFAALEKKIKKAEQILKLY